MSSRNEWVKDVMDLNDLHAMMCDVANGRRDEEPTRIDVKQFIESMDANGKMIICWSSQNFNGNLLIEPLLTHSFLFSLYYNIIQLPCKVTIICK